MNYEKIFLQKLTEEALQFNVRLSLTHLIIAVSAVFLFTICGQASSADAAEPLELTSNTTYTVTDDDRVLVDIDLNIVNNDPSTTKHEFGRSYYYSGVSVQVMTGYENITAVSSGGTKLGVSANSYHPQSPIQLISIDLDQKLFYGDRYRANISYTIGGIRSENIFISKNYLYFPVFTIGNSTSQINIDAPSRFNTNVSNARCSGAGGRAGSGGDGVTGGVVCDIEDPNVIGWAEILDDTQRSTISDEVMIGDLTYPIKVDFFNGEEQWANDTLGLVKRAIPLLHNEYSVPIPQSFTIVLKETGLSETKGYAGQYRCDDKAQTCTIVALPSQSKSTIVHETSHMWSFLYGSTWIAEGWAEFTANRAAGKLNYSFAPPKVNRSQYAQFPLDKWTNPQELLTSTSEEKEIIQLYYAKSAEVIDVLYRAIGENALRLANKDVAEQPGEVNSQVYFDALEKVSGVNLDGIFLEWIYGYGAEPKLKERRETVNNIVAFEKELRPLGLQVPKTVLQFRTGWDFKKTNEEILAAKAALPRLTSTQELLGQNVDPITGVVLSIIDPDRFYFGAKNAFNEGNFNKAIMLSQQAEKIHSYGPLVGIWLGAIIGLIVLLFVSRSMRKKI